MVWCPVLIDEDAPVYYLDDLWISDIDAYGGETAPSHSGDLLTLSVITAAIITALE